MAVERRRRRKESIHVAEKGKYVYDWPRPMVTADAAVFAFFDGRPHLLLIQRKIDPYRGHWALPGGFVEIDEDLPDAVARELAEETGLRNVPLEQLRAFGRPGRDPRGRTITIAYFGIAEKDWDRVRADDDAERVQWFDIEELPPMAFDHDEISRCAIERLNRQPGQGPARSPGR
jgi:8-oxo-dGTP diphosphatase